jgi:hypothetical protein
MTYMNLSDGCANSSRADSSRSAALKIGIMYTTYMVCDPNKRRPTAMRGVHVMAGQLSHDQISFYDESLKKQVEGSYRTDGKAVHVSSPYGIKSAGYGDLGTFVDQHGLDLLAQKLLSELARDPSNGKFKDLQQQKGDQQLQPRESYSCSGMRG